MQIKNFLTGLLLSAGLGLSAAATQAAPVLDTGWAADTLNDTNSPSTASPYVFSLTGAAYLRLTDAFLLGDTFSIYNNSLFVASSSIGIGGPAFGDDPTADAAWTSGSYSTLELLLGAGSYSIDVFGDCGGGCPAGFYARLDTAAIPLPAALPMLLAGLGGLGFLRLRKTL